MLLALGFAAGCAHAPAAPTFQSPGESQGDAGGAAQRGAIGAQEGAASWYGPGLYGRKTASGEVLRPGTLTAAHRTLPFGTCLRVTNLENGRTVQVRVNDRGPFTDDRIVDLSEAAASALGMRASGVARVRLQRCE